MNKISAVYQIINTVTNDRYVGSSRNVQSRWNQHKRPTEWKRQPNNQLYQDMQKYGVDKFRFQILAPVMPELLKQVEQDFIDTLKPAYNSNRANGPDVERQKESNKKWHQSKKGKESNRKSCKKYFQTNKGKESQRKSARKYLDQKTLYEGKVRTLASLRHYFKVHGIPTIEAKKYLFH